MVMCGMSMFICRQVLHAVSQCVHFAQPTAAMLIEAWSLTAEISMRKSTFQILWSASLVLLLLTVIQADDKPDTATSKIMEKKLQLSQAILSAVAKEDFVGMSKHAGGLLVLTKEQWIRNETPEFRAQLKDFWLVVDGLKTAADEKNADGATLAYVQMTLCCVKCHKYLRDRTE